MKTDGAAGIGSLKPRLLLKGVLLMASLALLGWAFEAFGLRDVLSPHWVDAEIRGHGLAGELLFVGLGAALVAGGLPRQALCFLGGYAFGFAAGTLWASLASLGGCILAFLYARLLGRDLVLHRFAARVRRVDEFLRGAPFTMTVLIRFLPVGSNLLTNLVAGVSSVRPLPFFLGSLLGYAPQTVVFVLLGSGIHVAPMLRISLSVLLFLLSAFLGVYLYRRLRHGHRLGGDIDAALDDGPEALGREVGDGTAQAANPKA